MYSVITIVVILAGIVLVWSKIQDQKIKQAQIELQQEQATAAKNAENEKVEKEYVNNLNTYFYSLHKHYFTATKIDDGKTLEGKLEQIDIIVNDADSIIALKTPDKYRIQQDQIIDIVNNIRTTAILAQSEEDPILMSLKLADSTVLIDDFMGLKDVIQKTPAPSE